MPFRMISIVTAFVMTILIMKAYGSTSSNFRSVWTAKLPHETWMNVMFMGVKVGYLYIKADKATYNGKKVLRVDSTMVTDVKRFGSSIRNKKTKTFFMKDDLTPIYFTSASDETGQEKLVEGTIDNGLIKIKTTLEGSTTERQQRIPPNTVFAESIEELTIRRGLKVGSKYSFTVFSLDFFDTMKVDVNIVQKDKIDYNGTLKEVFVVDYAMNIMGGITTREWMTQDGEIYKMEMPKLSMVFIKTDKEDALGETGQLDLIANTRIPIVGQKPASGVQALKLKVSIVDGNVISTFVNDSRQRVIPDKDDPSTGTLMINVLPFSEDKALNRPITREDLKDYLSPSIYIQSNDPDVKRKAEEIVGAEMNSWRSAVKLCRWVYENIKDKNYKVGFGSAKQTLIELQGDCSEHTVLFVGLARAVGIPARICTGLVFQRDAFYYHFWPEVFVGKWISMDPTLGQIQADATHLQFKSKPIETDSALELTEGVVKTMNRIRIERLE